MLKQLFFTCFSLGALVLGLQAQDTQKPNIVFIFSDDWGWADLSCHGHEYIKTPNIDRLAKEGTDFQRFTVASGVCSPSRAAIVTGHFPARYSINGHFAQPSNNARRGMPDWLALDAPFMPKMLQSAGYRTAHYGKWHLSNNLVPDSPSPKVYGYDAAWAFNCSGEQLPVHEDVLHSIEFIKSSVKEEKPFFLNLWIHEPHTPFHTVPRFEYQFRHIKDPADQIYAATLAHADFRIGQLLDTLDELNIADNTLVIFSSDNGPATGNRKPSLHYDTATGAGWNTGASVGTTGGKKGRKKSLFEGGVGVPFLARWPKVIPAGKIDDQSLISAVDILPTFCALAGAELPEGYTPDGMNITHIFKGDKMPSREKPLFWHYKTPYNQKTISKEEWANWTVLKKDWKLAANQKLDHIELYKISTDLSESHNLTKQHPEVVKELLAELKAWQSTLPKEPTGEVFSKHR